HAADWDFADDASGGGVDDADGAVAIADEQPPPGVRQRQGRGPTQPGPCGFIRRPARRQAGEHPPNKNRTQERPHHLPPTAGAGLSSSRSSSRARSNGGSSDGFSAAPAGGSGSSFAVIHA